MASEPPASQLQTLDMELDRISNEREGFLSCFTSSDTAGQIWHVRPKRRWTFFDDDEVPHC